MSRQSVPVPAQPLFHQKVAYGNGSPWSRAGESWSWGRFFLGFLQIVIGVFMLWHPVIGTLAFTTALALVAIVGGVGSVGLAFRARAHRKSEG